MPKQVPKLKSLAGDPMSSLTLAVLDLNLGNLPPPVISLLLGAVFLVLAMTGGNLEIKKIVKIPPIGTAWRALSLFFGTILFVSAVVQTTNLLSRFAYQTPAGPGPTGQSPPVVPSPNSNGRASGVNRNGTTKTDIPEAETTCDVAMTGLAKRANNPETKYTWGSYNRDLQELAFAAEALIDHLQNTSHSSASRTRTCISDLLALEGKIRGTACSRFQGNGEDGKPLDNDPQDHCGKNFEQFGVRTNLLIAKLQQAGFKTEGLDLSPDRAGFVTWYDESVVRYQNAQGQWIPVA
jgi:hypothetical protein